MDSLYIQNKINEYDQVKQSGQPVRILLVSSHTLVLKGITGMLKNVKDINVLGHARNRIDMMLMIDDLNPSLVLINDDEAGSDPPSIVDTISIAMQEFPGLNILMLISDEDLDKEFAALKIGVRGILSENSDNKTLIKCIKCLASGGLWLRRNVMEEFISEHLSLNKYGGGAKEALTIPSFTKRELEIIELAVKGKKNREIADKLYISEKTVKHHLSKIFKKLNIKRRSQLKGFL